MRYYSLIAQIALVLTMSASKQATVTAFSASHCDGSASGLLTVKAPNTGLTLSPTAVIGKGTSMGTIYLSAQAPSDGAKVTLTSSDPTISLPTSVTVPSGATQKSFTLTCSGVPSTTYATISVRYNGWTQTVTLTELPAGTRISVQNLHATPGNGCVLLHWQELPRGSFIGYNVYWNNSNTPLNGSPLPSSIYADTGLTNGTSYQYSVTVINLQGQESTGVQASATPTASAPTISWYDPPTTVTGFTSLSVVPSAMHRPVGYLLIDGQIVSSAASNIDQFGQVSTELFAKLISSSLGNGSHNAQIVGYDNHYAFASSVLSIQASNTFSNVINGGVFEPGTPCRIQATTPAGTVQWTLSILDAQDRVVRTWQGASSSVQLAWDGNDYSGSSVSEGSYTAQLTAQNSQQQQQVLRFPLFVLRLDLRWRLTPLHFRTAP